MKPLKFNLDFRSGVPGYVQIVEQVQTFLANGELKPGDQLPTVRQLASELRINFNTIARSYRMLDEAGLISTQQGRGTFILDQLSNNAVQKLKQESLEIQIRRFFQSLEKQGFDPNETEQAIRSLLKTWRDDSLGTPIDLDNE